MKKFLIISSFIFVILITSTIGYTVVSANTKIDEIEDIITSQQTKEDYLIYYNYTLDNPNIILNPYGNSPLTAIIIFETDTEEEVTVTIQGKDQNSTYTNTFLETKYHYLPIYGLYPDYNNKITITCGEITKEISIQTDKLPEDLNIIPKQNNTNNLYFITSDTYTYALDNNNEVRWYLTDNYTGKISRLENGHFLLSNTYNIASAYPTSLVEIDLLGKVYKEYDIDEPYLGSYTQTSNTILILSNNILELDTQTGLITREITLDDTYQTISYNNNTNLITLSNTNNTININYETEEITKTTKTSSSTDNEILLPLYNFDTYEISSGIKYTTNKETSISNKNIFLINYKQIDDNYNNYNIEIIKQDNHLIISGNFNNTDEVYLILDKFLGKKIYDLKNGYNYINQTGLSGNYSIYIKINDTIYKTNNYVSF